MAMASPSHSSSTKRSTLLVVELKSAAFGNKKKAAGNIYMNLWIHPKSKLKSRMVRYPKIGSNPVPWNQKFVFSLSHDFFNKDSSFWIQILRARKYLPDSHLGIAECKLGSLFFEQSGSENPSEKQADYDTEEDDSDRYSSGSDGSLPEVVLNEDQNGSEGESVRSFRKEEGYCEEKRCVSLEIISKGLASQGVLNVEMTLKRKYVSCIGKGEFGNFAMAYDEFMMDVFEDKAKLFMCFPHIQTNK